MEKFHKLILSIFIAVIIFSLSPTAVFTHPGGGPPFLKVNGEYAQTNPYFLGFPSFVIPMDVLTKNVLLNEEVKFEIDSNTLGIPPEILDQSQIRWQFEGPQSPYVQGLTAAYTFTKTGSYIVTVEIQGPNETSFTVLDSVQVNVATSRDYTPPKVEIITDKTSYPTNKEITFSTKITKDNKAAIKEVFWEVVGDKKISGETLTTTFTKPNTTQIVFVKVTDSNNLTSHASLYATNNSYSIDLKFPVVQTNSLSSQTTPSLPIPLSIVVILLLVISILFFKFRKMENKSQNA